jgi:sulfur-oxidizing protein SoxX
MVLIGLAVAAHVAAAEPAARSYRVSGDAIAAPLAEPGDAQRGRDIVGGRDGNCLLCHAVPGASARFMGDIAPPLGGIGARLSAGQLRLRVVDPSYLNPDTVMPSYYRVDGLHRVAPAFRGRPILSAAQIEDVVAYLQTLR